MQLHSLLLSTLLLSLSGGAHAFSTLTPARTLSPRSSSPVCLDSSRRQAVISGASALLAVAALPKSAFADSTEEMMAKIAEKNRIALQKEKEEKREKLMSRIKEEEDPSEKFKKIASVGIGGVVLSVPFYYRNIQRLFTKVSSGGKDDGYSTVGKKASGGQKASGGVDAGKVGNAAKRLFLGK